MAQANPSTPTNVPTPPGVRYHRTSTDRNSGQCDRHSCDKEVLCAKGYVIRESLGHGSYSKVKLAVLKSNVGARFAIKIIDRRRAPQDYQKNFLPRELATVRTLRHPYIIETYDVFEQNNKVYMILEYAQEGDVLDYVRFRSQGFVGEALAKRWVAQTAHALMYMHARSIAHRDVKCENLLLSTGKNIKLSDFGFVRHVSGNELSHTYCGSAAYAAPEIIRSTPYNPFLTDVWALGVVLFIISTGLMPFGEDVKDVSRILQIQLAGIQFPTAPRHRVSTDCQLLIRGMLAVNARQRFTLPQILSDKWLSKTS
ncbi:Testis-specific serine/threonine-protein kinase 2 [Holothuria leucospilota]|uniref:Testis-specific serine/threonine-protein kinase 2 n=1 Tax=Holothuria leucospilota TaxID=206669 RepID=A0A9Q1CHG2_HOLLE|nr:Testis-specific serine/threonine-protein kinase 2 [Holothuria leucospilota]